MINLRAHSLGKLKAFHVVVDSAYTNLYLHICNPGPRRRTPFPTPMMDLAADISMAKMNAANMENNVAIETGKSKE